MPLKRWDTKADFDGAYGSSGDRLTGGRPTTRPPIRLHYHRATLYPAAQRRAAKFAELFGWTAGSRVVIVGAGFGWTMEALEEILPSIIVLGTDTSAYVQAQKNNSEEAELREAIVATGLDPDSGEGADKLSALLGSNGPRARLAARILNENLLTRGSRRRVRTAVGAINCDVVTENVLESLADAEAQEFSAALHGLTGGLVAHYVTPLLSDHLQDEGYNWKLLEDWKALIPTDTWVEAGTFRIT